MDNRKKKIAQVGCVLTISGVSFGLGQQSTNNDNAGEENLSGKQFTNIKDNIQSALSNRIVIINQDQTQEYEGKSYNFGNMLSQALNSQDNYEIETNDETSANAGVNSGYYAAKILIPSDFTKSILTVNDKSPNTANIEYSLSTKISQTKQKSVQRDILKLGEGINSAINYLYINGIFDGLHNAQNYVEYVITNNNDTANKIEDLQSFDFTNDKSLNLEPPKQVVIDDSVDDTVNFNGTNLEGNLTSSINKQTDKLKKDVSTKKANEEKVDTSIKDEKQDMNIEMNDIDLQTANISGEKQKSSNQTLNQQINDAISDSKVAIDEADVLNKENITNGKTDINDQVVNFDEDQKKLIDEYNEANTNFLSSLLLSNEKIDPLSSEVDKSYAALKSWVANTNVVIDNLEDINIGDLYQVILDFIKEMYNVSNEYKSLRNNLIALSEQNSNDEQLLENISLSLEKTIDSLNSNKNSYEQLYILLENSIPPESPDHDSTYKLVQQMEENNNTSIDKLTTINKDVESAKAELQSGNVSNLMSQIKDNINNLDKYIGTSEETNAVYEFVNKLSVNSKGQLVFNRDEEQILVGNDRGEISIPYDKYCKNTDTTQGNGKLTCDALGILKIVNTTESTINKNNQLYQQSIKRRTKVQGETDVSLEGMVPENINTILGGYTICKNPDTNTYSLTTCDDGDEIKGLSQVSEELQSVFEEINNQVSAAPKTSSYNIDYSLSEKINSSIDQIQVSKPDLNLQNEEINSSLANFNTLTNLNLNEIINEVEKTSIENGELVSNQLSDFKNNYEEKLRVNNEYQSKLGMLIDQLVINNENEKMNTKSIGAEVTNFNINVEDIINAHNDALSNNVKQINENQEDYRNTIDQSIEKYNASIENQQEKISEFVNTLNDNSAYQRKISVLSNEESKKNSEDKANLDKLGKILPNTKNGDIENRVVYKFISKPTNMVEDTQKKDSTGSSDGKNSTNIEKEGNKLVPVIGLSILGISLIIAIKRLKKDTKEDE